MDDEKPLQSGLRKWLPAWLKICAALLAFLIFLKIIGLEIIVEIDLGEEPKLAALTELETYYIPLAALLLLFLLLWIWDTLFGPRDR